ncbi:MAG: hypothetical protein JWP97_2369 [Labilithrix sp.]|nr:hypothetical protein [Labilithrix sp.]
MRHARWAALPLLLTIFTARSAAAQSNPPPQNPQEPSNPDPGQGAAAPSNAPQPRTVETMPSQPLPAPAGTTPRSESGPERGPGLTAPQSSPATPAPTPLEQATNAMSALFRFYGTLKPTMIVSAGTLESFGQPNASAETAAGNPVLATLPKDTRLTFQMAQTRLGFWVAEKSNARGHVEIDFVDFTKSSPTVASMPRLRIAMVEYEPFDRFVIGMGQDWDLYGPVNPFGTNLVGANFEAGNTGFMRQQVRAVYSGKTAELGAMVGLQAPNNTFRDAGQELSRVPVFAVRGALVSGKSRLGISGIATQLRLNPGAPTERRTGAYGGQLYWDLMPADGFQIKGEAYIGRNLNNIGTLALGFGNAAHDIDEVGGFFSTRDQLADKHAVYLTAGIAQALHPSEVSPDYTYTPGTAATATSAAVAASRALAATGPGLRVNMTARLGYEYRPVKPLAFVAEAFVYRTRHQFQQADWNALDPMRVAPGAEVGVMYTF